MKIPRNTSSVTQLRVFLGVGERERRAPRPTENQPALDAEVFAQLLHVGDEMPGRVVDEARVGAAAPASALVEHHDPVTPRDRRTVASARQLRRPVRRARTQQACHSGCRTPRNRSRAAAIPAGSRSDTAPAVDRACADPRRWLAFSARSSPQHVSPFSITRAAAAMLEWASAHTTHTTLGGPVDCLRRRRHNRRQ